MNKKIILVTGAGKGIGFETVRQLCEMRHEVLLGTRNEKQGQVAIEKLAEMNLVATHILLDITNEKDIENAAAFIKNKYAQLDVLINNAGILLEEDITLPAVSNDVWERTIHTNVTSPLYLTRALVPLMVRGGRIINVSSGGGSMSDPVGGWSPAYCVSKSMLNALTRQMSHHLAGKGISVNAMSPGWVRSDMGGQHAPRSLAQGADTSVWLATEENIPTGKFFYERKVVAW